MKQAKPPAHRQERGFPLLDGCLNPQTLGDILELLIG